jgi:tetratricopeptide (TPR) repeat protein
MNTRRWGIVLGGIALLATFAFADDNFDKLIRAKKYKEAIDYADNNIPPASRTAEIWVAIARANEELGLAEKSMACYLVSSRMNPKDFDSWLGAARIYNKLGQYESGLDAAKKALDLNFNGDASWEYANACIKLNRSVEAKKALEKVIESDPTNVVANRELGNIYFNDKEYEKAVPLLKKSYDKKADPEIAYRLGKAALETNDLNTAADFLKQAFKMNSSVDIGLELARLYYKIGDYSNAGPQYDKSLSSSQTVPMDYYQNAVSKEKGGDQKSAINAYDNAIRAFGSSTQKESLQSRLIVSRNQLDKKEFSGALSNLKFIAANDAKGAIAPDINFMLADAYEGLKQIDQAIGSLEKALSIDSKNVEAYARLADLYKRVGNENRAKSTYEKMISLSPNDPGVYLTLGQYNLKSKNWQPAFEQFQKSNMLKKSAQASEGMAIAASNLNRWDNAKDAAQDAVQMDGTLDESRKILATALFKDGSFSAAIEHYEVLVKKSKSNIEYWKNLAECYNQTNQIDRRAEADRTVADLDKSNVDARLRLGDYLLSKKDAKGAYQVYGELATLTPKNATVYQNLYTLALQSGDKASALARVQQYLALNPKDAAAQRDMGDLLYERKDLDGALKAYREALSLDPKIKGFFKRYAEIVVAKGQHDEAIRAITGKITAGEATADDYTTLGNIYQKKQSYQKAIESYEKSLQMQPQNADVLSSLAECQALNGMTNEAIITYEQSIMMNANSSKEYKSLGDLYGKQGKPDQAIKAYRKYLEKVPSDNQIAKQVAMYLVDQKKYDEGIKYLNMIQGPDANDFDLQLTLARAYYLSKDYKNAIKVLDALQSRAQSGSSAQKDVLRMLADSYEQTGQNEPAARTYQVYCQKPGVNDPDAAYKVAFLQEKGNQTAAVRAYEDNVTKYPRDFRNYLQLGMMYSDSKDKLTRAIQLFSKITSMADSIPQIWLKLAEVYGKMGKDEDELKAYKAYIRTEPQNVGANKRIGTILVKKGQYKEGLIYLETAITLDPKDPEVQCALAEGYSKTNRPNEAISALEKAKAVKPKDLNIIGQLTRNYLKVGRGKDAKRVVDEWIALEPNNPETHLLRAHLLCDDKDYKTAQNEIENVMAMSPSIESFMLQGKILMGLRDYKSALKSYDEVINNGTENVAQALYEKAELYRLYGKELEKSPKWAETFYERAMKADPNFALPELGLARLYKLWKKDDMYRMHLEKAKRIDPNNQEINDEYKLMGK